MPQMFQQALWICGTDQEDKGQEVDLLKSMTGAGLERSSAPVHFQKDCSSYSDASYREQPARIRLFAFQPIQFANGIVAEGSRGPLMNARHTAAPATEGI
jgi:hypothetical protein